MIATLIAIAIFPSQALQSQQCKGPNCATHEPIYNVSTDYHLTHAPHNLSMASIAGMSEEQKLTLHDKLHRDPKPSALGIATTRIRSTESASPLGLGPNGATNRSTDSPPASFPLGGDAAPCLGCSASTLHNPNMVPLGLIPPLMVLDSPRVHSETRTINSGGRPDRIHAIALAGSPGRPCPPLWRSPNTLPRLAHLIHRLRSR